MNRKSNKNTEPVIVIDIGGTNFRSSIFVKDKEFIEKPRKFLTPNFISNSNLKTEELQKLLIDRIVGTVMDYKKKNPRLKLVGLSFPAPMTSDGIVNQACTVWGDKGRNFPLLRTLSASPPSFSWTVANDITAAAERYANMQKYQNIDFFGIITISSGIGSKIYDVRNRKVILDRRGIGGEMGHIKIDYSPNAPLCDCGGRGHLGALASGRAIERQAVIESKNFPAKFKKSLLSKLAKKPEDINNNLLVSAIKAGDKFCLQILNKATFPLACSIAHVSGNIGVDKFIIIGGFALNCGYRYLESLQANLLKTDFYSRRRREIPTLVELGINDDNDCLIGIGLLAQKKYAETA